MDSARSGILRYPLRLGTVFVPDLIRDTADWETGQLGGVPDRVADREIGGVRKVTSGIGGVNHTTWGIELLIKPTLFDVEIR